MPLFLTGVFFVPKTVAFMAWLHANWVRKSQQMSANKRKLFSLKRHHFSHSFAACLGGCSP
jgi:hypothetical protein